MTPSPPKPQLHLGENFHFSFGFKTGSLNLNLSDPESLPETPQAGIYDDERPISGIFTGGSIREFRTVLTAVWQYRGQLISAGGGIFNLQVGNPGEDATKGQSRASMHLNGITSEISVLRKFSGYGYTKGTLHIDGFVDGELQRRYLIRSDGTLISSPASLGSGYRLSISGEYLFNTSMGFSVGATLGLEYGLLQFEKTNGATSIYGITYGLSAVLRI